MSLLMQRIVSFFSKLLSKNQPKPQVEPNKTKSLQLIAFDIAMAEMGVKEVDGAGNNPRILEYHQATTLKATSDSIAWCSSFLNYCIKKAGLPGTGSAMARSWLLWANKVDKPCVGDVVILSRGNDGVSGHVGFVAKEVEPLSPFIYVLGGNQQNAVGINKYLKTRVLGYRRS